MQTSIGEVGYIYLMIKRSRIKFKKIHCTFGVIMQLPVVVETRTAEIGVD